MENKLLTDVEKGIEAKIDPAKKDAYTRILVAGMKVMFDEKTHKMMAEQLQSSGDMKKNIAEGIAGLMAILYKESKNKMPIDSAVPASIVLMTKAMAFAEKTMGLELTPDFVAETTQATSEAVLLKFGVTKKMIQEMVAKSQSGQGGEAQPQPQPAPEQQAPAGPTGLIGA